MNEHTDWDAIVIGAGMAGLSCAAHLAKADKRVVVVEQHSRPGGLWASFSRRGIIFDLSTHWVTEPQTLNRMLEALGASSVEFVQLDRLGRYVGPAGSRGYAWDIVVGPDAEAFRESVRRSFPTVDEVKVAALMRAAVDFSRLADSLPVHSPELAPRGERLRAALSLLPHLRRLRHLGTMPAEEYLARLFPGEELAGLRAALYTLAPIPGMSAVGPLAMLGTGLRGRAYAPKGGSQILADAFAEAALRNGAEIWYSKKAVSILTVDGATRGIRLADGTELHAHAVISAADAKQTFYQLLGRDKVPDSYKKILEAQPVSEPYGLISIVTTLDPAVAGFDGTDVFVCPSADVPRALETKEPEECAFLLVFPRYSQPDTDPTLRAVQVVAPAAWAWGEHWETWPTPERGAAYQALKEEWSSKIILRVQEYFPGLASHLEVVDVATPITFHRYTLNTEGAPVGWHYTSRRRWRQTAPFVRGLYQAGHWAGPSGALPATRSGKWAAELVLRRLAKVDQAR